MKQNKSYTCTSEYHLLRYVQSRISLERSKLSWNCLASTLQSTHFYHEQSRNYNNTAGLFSNLDSSGYQTFIKKAKQCKDITSTVKWKTWCWTTNTWVWNPDRMTFIHTHTHTHHKKKTDMHSIFLLMVKYLSGKNCLIKNSSYANYIHNYNYEHDIKKILEINIYYQLGHYTKIVFNSL